MKLTDLNPWWVGCGGEGVTLHGQPVPRRERIAIEFDCPCGTANCLCIIEFANPEDGAGPSRSDGHTWQRTGTTFETLSLTPSILRRSPCGWHGYLTDGELRSV